MERARWGCCLLGGACADSSSGRPSLTVPVRGDRQDDALIFRPDCDFGLRRLPPSQSAPRLQVRAPPPIAADSRSSSSGAPSRRSRSTADVAPARFGSDRGEIRRPGGTDRESAGLQAEREGEEAVRHPGRAQRHWPLRGAEPSSSPWIGSSPRGRSTANTRLSG
jgi:hypothetical protein